jgi:hypothetical protein
VARSASTPYLNSPRDAQAVSPNPPFHPTYSLCNATPCPPRPLAGRRSPVAGHYFCHHYGDKLDFSRGLESGDGLVEGGELAGHNSGGKETTHDRSDLGAAGGSIFANAHAFYDAHESEPVVGGRSHDRLDRDIHDVPARFVTGRVSTYNGFLGFEQTRVVGKKAFGFVSGE